MATILGSVYFNFSAGKYVSAGLLGTGFLTISILYGLYMFTPSGDVITNTISGPWPPTINVCPDLLSVITLNGNAVCIDPIGVSNQTANGLKKWNNSGNTGTDYVFDLHLAKTGQNRIAALCTQCLEKGLTWEGVCVDGTPLTNQPPIPASAT